MKYVLIILCGLMVLFAGGCAVLAVMAGPLALVPAAFAALNVMIIFALLTVKPQWRWVFYILGVIDLMAAVAVGLFEPGFLGDKLTFEAVAAILGLKGILSIIFAARQRGA